MQTTRDCDYVHAMPIVCKTMNESKEIKGWKRRNLHRGSAEKLHYANHFARMVQTSDHLRTILDGQLRENLGSGMAPLMDKERKMA